MAVIQSLEYNSSVKYLSNLLLLDLEGQWKLSKEAFGIVMNAQFKNRYIEIVI